MPDNDETFDRVLPGNQVEQLASVSDRIIRKKEQQGKKQQHQQKNKQHKNIEEQLEQEKKEKIIKARDGHIDFHA